MTEQCFLKDQIKIIIITYMLWCFHNGSSSCSRLSLQSPRVQPALRRNSVERNQNKQRQVLRSKSREGTKRSKVTILNDGWVGVQTESVEKKSVELTRFTSLFDIKGQEQGTLGVVSELRAIRGASAQSLQLRQKWLRCLSLWHH